MISEEAKLTMELTPFMLKKMKEVFEIEILQGTCEKMEDGRYYVEIELSEEKAQFTFEWMKTLVNNPKVQAKLNGIPIHRN